jgi:hypothetical protein
MHFDVAIGESVKLPTTKFAPPARERCRAKNLSAPGSVVHHLEARIADAVFASHGFEVFLPALPVGGDLRA